jgi:protein TonB
MLLYNKQDQITYALTKDNFVSISLDAIQSSELIKPKSDTKSSEEKPKESALPKAKPVETKNKKMDINDLFSSVKTQDIKKETKKEEIKKEQKRVTEEPKSKPKSDDTTRSESLQSKLEKLSSDTKSSEAKKVSSGSEINEYNAKIQALVYEHFYPPSNSEGRRVRVVVVLNPLGKMTDFRVLEYSDHEGLNEEIRSLKSRLESLVFPKSPNGKSQQLILVLIPEEKF